MKLLILFKQFNHYVQHVIKKYDQSVTKNVGFMMTHFIFNALNKQTLNGGIHRKN